MVYAEISVFCGSTTLTFLNSLIVKNFFRLGAQCPEHLGWVPSCCALYPFGNIIF